MSLEWPRQKIFTSKHFNSYLGFMPFSVKHEETFSKKLRDSLMSVEIKTCSLDCDFFSTQNSTAEIDDDEEEEIWEPVGDCASDCSHINCPFRAQDDAEIFISSKTQISGSKNSLLRVVSSMSMFNATVFERTSFLTITRLVPVRDSAVIIHWSIKSTFGIRGYMVYLDGILAAKIFSSGRTTALIKDIDMSVPHHFAVAIIRIEDENIFKNFSRKAAQIEPAVYVYKP